MRLVPIERDGSSAAPPAAASEAVNQVMAATIALYGRRGFIPPWTGYLELTRPAAMQHEVQYIAHTLPEHGASTSVLRALGFALLGEIQHPEDGLVTRQLQ